MEFQHIIMENEYSDVVAQSVDHSEHDSLDYVNATEAVHSTVLVQPPQYEVEDEHEYSEVIRTVTITQDEDGDGIADSQVTVTTIVRSNDDDVSDHQGDADAISKHSDAAHEGYNDVRVRNADVGSRKSDADSNSDYEIVLEASKTTISVEHSSKDNEASEKEENDDKQASLLVKGHVLVDYVEAESLVERLVENELERDSIEADVAVKVNLNEEGEQDDQKERNIYEYVDYVDAESCSVRHVELGEYGNREEEQEYANMNQEPQLQQHQQQQQQHREESIYQNNYDDDAVYDSIQEPVVSKTRQSDWEPAVTQHNESEHMESAATVTATFSVQSENQETKSFQKTPPPSSGKFIMRSVSKADPRHVVQCITQNSKETLHRDPEQDELVYYIKGETEGSEMKQRIKSWLAPSLIQQFNKESETGSEVGQSFLPKNVGVSSVRSSALSSSVTREIRSVTSPTSPTGPKIPVENGATFEESRGPETHQRPILSPSSPPASTIRSPTVATAVSLSDDPTIRNAEIAKAVEAADFKPVAHQNGVDHGSKKKEVVEQTTTSNSTKGVSIYSKQASVKVEVINGVAPSAKQNNAQPSADWKAEVERRKQTRDFIVTQKPTQPLKLAEIPEWKLALMEKNKQRKSSSADSSNEPISAEAVEDVELEWKKEIRQILKQKSTTEVNIDQANDIPEWQKIANSKK